jgi:hypothetical protein
VLPAIRLRVVDLPDTGDWPFHPLRNLTVGNTLGDLLGTALRENQVPIYDPLDYAFGKPISYSQYKAAYKFGEIDSIVDGNSISICNGLRASDFSMFNINKYEIVENWNFDIASGITNVQVIGIIPMSEDPTNSRNYHEMLLKYTDVKNILALYNQYHPTNNLTTHIWYDYFISDVKPTIIK